MDGFSTIFYRCTEISSFNLPIGHLTTHFFLSKQWLLIFPFRNLAVVAGITHSPSSWYLKCITVLECLYIFDLQTFFFSPATQRTPKATEVVFPMKSATNVDLRILVDKVIGPSAVWGDPYKPYQHVLTPDVEGKGYFLLGLTAEPTKERMTWWWWWCVVRTACGTCLPTYATVYDI